MEKVSNRGSHRIFGTKKPLLLVLLSVMLQPSVFADLKISGDLTQVNFSSPGGRFEVTSDLLVPEDAKITIPAGTVLMFNEFTGVKIDGALITNGTEENPVVFTSIYDTQFRPDSPKLPGPLDWNGVLISRKSSGVHLKNFHLRFSTFGIKTQKPSIRIENGKFARNGQFHLEIDNEVQMVQEDIPFDFPVEPGRGASQLRSSDGTTDRISGTSGPGASENEIAEPRDRRWWKFRSARVGIGTAGVLLAGAGVTFAVLSNTYHEDLDRMREIEPGVVTDAAKFSETWNEKRRKMDSTNAAATALFVLSGLSATGFALTFTF